MTSKIEICNLALSRIAANNIASLNGGHGSGEGSGDGI